jgi:hypothetical protein
LQVKAVAADKKIAGTSTAMGEASYLYASTWEEERRSAEKRLKKLMPPDPAVACEHHFLLGLPGEPILVSQLRKGGHPLSQLYHGVTEKTISRDLNYLKNHKLIKIEGGQVSANVEMMRAFMPARTHQT